MTKPAFSRLPSVSCSKRGMPRARVKTCGSIGFLRELSDLFPVLKTMIRAIKFCIFVLVSLASLSCTQETAEPVATDARWHDYFSFANTDQFVTENLSLDLTVDFEAEVLHGNATLRIRRIETGAAEIILDTRDLSIETVGFISASGELLNAEHRFGETHSIMGTPLFVSVPTVVQDTEELTLRIDYRTSPKSTALQWLPPGLTAGLEQPFLFSQSQAIHARSWIPLQDTPAVRITYTATIHTPPELLAVMSANNDPAAERDGTYEFEMPQPIPSYLLAIAVGNIYFAPIGDETGVYSEPELLDASVFEFADTQAMLETAEAMFGPYQWGRYDLLILPPSFPYGGMENPRLSFLTPSLLAGDRSLVSVVAHELAHSWSGNLVTNATWRDGWLNEGWTSYLGCRRWRQRSNEVTRTTSRALSTTTRATCFFNTSKMPLAVRSLIRSLANTLATSRLAPLPQSCFSTTSTTTCSPHTPEK